MDLLHKNRAWRLLVVAALALLEPRMGWSAPLEVYGHLPDLEDVSLSPDGTRVAMVNTLGNDRFLFVVSLTEHKRIGKAIGIGTVKLRAVQWADNNRLLLISSMTAAPVGLIGAAHEWSLLSVWDIDKQKMYGYPDPAKSPDLRIMNALFGAPMVRRIEGHTMLFVPGLYLSDYTEPALFRVDLDTSLQRIVREGTLQTESWLVDEAGDVAAEEDYDQQSQHWKILERHDGHLQEIASGHAPIEIPELLGFGPDPGTLLVETKQDGDPVWRLLSMKDGTFGAAMEERSSLEYPIEDTQTHRMIGGVHTDDIRHYVFFDRRIRTQWQSVLDGYSGETVEFVSASADFSKIVVKVTGPLHGFSYELVDLDTHRGLKIGDIYNGIELPLEVKSITYKAADGLDIPAYLTLPMGKPPKNLPLIVFPHGGPAVRDMKEFDWWAQAMAAQGYLVLQPNYRGSATTTDHLEAGYGQWGRKMQTDLSDGVRYLVKEGLVDPTRVCIVGASYGGYAALAGVTLDPGVYRCAVAVAGISDLKLMVKSVDSINSSERRYWQRFMGAGGPSDPVLDQLSPIKHVDAITVPVMLIHGRDDTVVAYDQSSDMYDAMRHEKKDVEFVKLKNEDHWLSRSETRLQMLQSSIAFLRAHNPPE